MGPPSLPLLRLDGESAHVSTPEDLVASADAMVPSGTVPKVNSPTGGPSHPRIATTELSVIPSEVPSRTASVTTREPRESRDKEPMPPERPEMPAIEDSIPSERPKPPTSRELELPKPEPPELTEPEPEPPTSRESELPMPEELTSRELELTEPEPPELTELEPLPKPPTSRELELTEPEPPELTEPEELKPLLEQEPSEPDAHALPTSSVSVPSKLPKLEPLKPDVPTLHA